MNNSHSDKPKPANPSPNKDAIYAAPLNHIPGFTFDQNVVDVFPDMIKRSVPGYEAIVSMIGELAVRYAQPNSNIYDLGCSLGASLLSICHHLPASQVDIIGVDNSAAMIQSCRQLVEANQPSNTVHLLCQDIETIELKPSSLVVLNFTLQFVELQKREELIKKIFNSLLPNGVLIVSEKICFIDSQHQQLMTELHENFKRANGYSELEISQKRSSLENVLVPETLDAHLKRFENVGFRSSDVWFQCLNFASMLAIKC